MSTTPTHQSTDNLSGPAPLPVADHIAVVAAEGRNFAEAARRGDLEAPVPTCPDWTVRDLVRHLSEIHLWAAARVAGRTDKLWIDDLAELTESWPGLAVFWPADDALIDWYLQTNDNLVRALEAAPPDLVAPTFLPAPSPLAMWARRQAHETSVHRFDAEVSSGDTTGFAPSVAADGIDELLYGFLDRPGGKELPVDQQRVLRIHAADTGDTWQMAVAPDGFSRSAGAAPADLTVEGAAADLYLLLWNRGEDSTVALTGDAELLGIWHDNARIQWG